MKYEVRMQHLLTATLFLLILHSGCAPKTSVQYYLRNFMHKEVSVSIRLLSDEFRENGSLLRHKKEIINVRDELYAEFSTPLPYDEKNGSYKFIVPPNSTVLIGEGINLNCSGNCKVALEYGTAKDTLDYASAEIIRQAGKIQAVYFDIIENKLSP